MIAFKNITWKNFLSTGANEISIDLNRHKSTLIVGHNGAGKSTMLDALSFALFGKPHRNVKKNQLINSVNGKGALVEVEFETSGHKFKIARGIKPNIFEIYQNDKIIDQSANTRDYQKFLEQNILKLNHKSFHQIVVLGSSSFVPFMQLPQHHRREVIEDLLDVNIFSKMKSILKDRATDTKSHFKDTKLLLDAEKSKIIYQQNHVNKLDSLNKAAMVSKADDLLDLEKDLKDCANDLQAKTEEMLAFGDLAKIQSDLNTSNSEKTSLTLNMGEIKSGIKALVTKSRFFEANNECPTCKQKITKDLKMQQMEGVKDAAKALEDSRVLCSHNIGDVDSNISELHRCIQEITSVGSEIKTIQINMQMINNMITEHNNKSYEITDVADDLAELNRLKKSADELRDTFDELSDKMLYNDIASEMLKDTGIRTKVIKEYLPAMNMLINQYLQTLDFFVSFNLDENFSETIKSRHRDSFVYANFSEGEKQRIDLALLFAWRKIAQMKNSTNTNLLILDETFDSSLDTDGVDNLMKILYSLDENTNTFVISHKPDLLESKLKSKIEFKKLNNFSALV
jgi:DNA repair exonuclease SbcCD ATPase subunit